MAEKQLTNPSGAFGYTGLTDNTGFRTEIPLVAAGTIAAGKLVVMGSTGTITQATTGSTSTLVCGVATKAAVSGDVIPVVIYGIADVLAKGTVTSGDMVARSGTEAASVVTAGSSAAGGVVGVALTTATDATVTIWVGLRG
jgi:hypothetical protein